MIRVYHFPQIPYPPGLGIMRADQETLIEAAFYSFWHKPPAVGHTVGRMGGRVGPPDMPDDLEGDGFH